MREAGGAGLFGEVAGMNKKVLKIIIKIEEIPSCLGEGYLAYCPQYGKGGDAV